MDLGSNTILCIDFLSLVIDQRIQINLFINSVNSHNKITEKACFLLLSIFELISFQVEAGEYEFDYCLSSLDFLPNLSHMPKILRDKMPNTRRGNV